MPLSNSAQITINVGAKLQVLQSSVDEIQKILDKLEPNSLPFKRLSSVITNVRNDMEKLQIQTSKGFVSQSQFNQTERTIDKIESSLSRTKIILDSLKFKDIKLTKSQEDTFKNFEQEIEKIEERYTEAKENIKKGLFSDSNLNATLIRIDKNAINKDLEDVEKIVNRRANSIRAELAFMDQNLKQLQASVNKGSRAAALTNEGFTQASLGEDLFKKYLYTKNGNTLLKPGVLKQQFLKELAQEFDINPDELTSLSNLTLKKIQEAFKEMGAGTRANPFAGITDGLENQQKKLADLSANFVVTQNFANSIAILQQKFAELNGEQGAITVTTEQYNQALSVVAETIGITKEKVLEEARALALHEDQSKKNNQALEQLRQALSETNAEFLRQQRQLQTFNSIKSAVVNFMGFNQVLNITRTAIREAINHIKELDTTMNGIAIVTDMTTADLWKQVDAYSSMAQKYGVTIQGAYEVSKIYYQAGYETNEVLTLMDETLKLSKISGLDYATTTDYMMTAMRGFKLEMEDASRVVDVYSNLAANTAVSQQELAEAMTRTASSMESVGATFEETSAMIATMVAVTRESANNIGSAMKSIASRYGELTKDPTKLVDADGEAMAFNKVDAALKSVGISMRTTDGQFREFTEVIVELAEKWSTLDSVQQRYIATQFAGNRQQSRFLALVSNIDLLRANMDVAENSEDVGTLQALKALDSLESKINQVQVAYQQFYTTIGIESAWKTFLDGTKSVINTLNSLPKLFGKIPVNAIAAISSVISVIKTVLFGALSLIIKEWQVYTAQNNEKMAQENQAGGTKSAQSWINSFLNTWRFRKGEITSEMQSTIVEGTAKTMPGSTGTTLPGTAQSNTTKTFNSIANGAKSAAKYINIAGQAISAFSLLINTTSQNGKKLSGALMSIGGAVSLISGVISKNPIAIITGLLNIISGFSTAYESVEERVERLNQEATELSNKAKEIKANYNILDRSIKKLNELQQKRYESSESAEEYQNAINELAESFPELVIQFTDTGDAIINVKEAEELLAQKRLETVNATYTAAKKEKELAEARAQEAGEELLEAASKIHDVLLGNGSISIRGDADYAAATQNVSKYSSEVDDLEDAVLSRNGQKIFEAVNNLYKTITDIQSDLAIEIGDLTKQKEQLDQIKQKYQNYKKEVNTASVLDRGLYTQWQQQKAELDKEAFSYVGSGLEAIVSDYLYNLNKDKGGFNEANDYDYVKTTELFDALYDAVKIKGDEALQGLTERLNNPDFYSGTDIVEYIKDLEIELNKETEKILSSGFRKENSDKLKVELKNLLDTYKNIPKDLRTEIENRTEKNAEQLTEFERRFYASILPVVSSYEDLGLTTPDFVGLLNDIQALPPDLKKAILANGFATKEAIEKTINSLKTAGYTDLANDFELIKNNIISNLNLSITASLEKFASDWSDASKEFKKLTSGLDVSEALQILQKASTLDGVNITAKDFQTVNGKLILAQQKADEYWKAYIKDTEKQIETWEKEIEKAEQNLENKNTLEELKQEADAIANLVGIEVWSTLWDKEAQDFKVGYDKVRTAISEALKQLGINIANANAALGWASDEIEQETNWNKGDFSSLGLNKAQIKALATGSMPLGQNDTAKRAARDKINSGFKSLISDVLSKGIENINLSDYSGILDYEKGTIRQYIANRNYKGLIEKYAKYATDSIEEINSFIMQAVEKGTSISAQDALKDIDFYASNIAYASKDTVVKLASAISDMVGKDVFVNDIIAGYNEQLNQYRIDVSKIPLEQITNSTEILFESISARIDSITKDINNGIVGKTTRTDIDNLNARLEMYGIQGISEADFTETKEGLRYSEQAAFRLYNDLKNIQGLQNILTFEELAKTLKETNDNYRTMATLQARINELQEKTRYQRQAGNVDLFAHARNQISAQQMVLAGYSDFDRDSYATLYSSTYSGEEYGANIVLNITPITNDGREILSPQDLDSYVEWLLSSGGTANDILQLDAQNRNLLMGAWDVDVSDAEKLDAAIRKAVKDAERLHEESEGIISDYDKMDIPSNARIKQYEEELALAKQIKAERVTSYDETFDFMNGKLAGGLQNPIAYMDSWGKAFKTWNEAISEDGGNLIDATAFYNIVQEANRIAGLGGEIEFLGYKLDGHLETAAKVISQGFNHLKDIDGTGSKVDLLASFGDSLDITAGQMGTDIENFIHKMAESQIQMLDAMIQFLEAIVTMEELGDIDVDKNGIFNLKDIFKYDDQDEITAFTDEWAAAIHNFSEKMSEAQKEWFKGIKIIDDTGNAHTLLEIVNADYNDLQQLGISMKDYGELMKSLIEFMKTDSFDTENLDKSFREFLLNSDFNGKIEVGEVEWTVGYDPKIKYEANGAETDGIKPPLSGVNGEETAQTVTMTAELAEDTPDELKELIQNKDGISRKVILNPELGDKHPELNELIENDQIERTVLLNLDIGNDDSGLFGSGDDDSTPEKKVKVTPIFDGLNWWVNPNDGGNPPTAGATAIAQAAKDLYAAAIALQQAVAAIPSTITVQATLSPNEVHLADTTVTVTVPESAQVPAYVPEGAQVPAYVPEGLNVPVNVGDATVPVVTPNPVPVSVGNASVPVDVGEVTVPVKNTEGVTVTLADGQTVKLGDVTALNKAIAGLQAAINAIPQSFTVAATLDQNTISLAEGSTVTLADGQTVTLAEGQTVTLADGQTVTLAKGQTVTLAAGQTVTLGDTTAITNAVVNLKQAVNTLQTTVNALNGIQLKLPEGAKVGLDISELTSAVNALAEVAKNIPTEITLVSQAQPEGSASSQGQVTTAQQPVTIDLTELQGAVNSLSTAIGNLSKEISVKATLDPATVGLDKNSKTVSVTPTKLTVDTSNVKVKVDAERFEKNLNAIITSLTGVTSTPITVTGLPDNNQLTVTLDGAIPEIVTINTDVLAELVEKGISIKELENFTTALKGYAIGLTQLSNGIEIKAEDALKAAIESGLSLNTEAINALKGIFNVSSEVIASDGLLATRRNGKNISLQRGINGLPVAQEYSASVNTKVQTGKQGPISTDFLSITEELPPRDGIYWFYRYVFGEEAADKVWKQQYADAAISALGLEGLKDAATSEEVKTIGQSIWQSLMIASEAKIQQTETATQTARDLPPWAKGLGAATLLAGGIGIYGGGLGATALLSKFGALAGAAGAAASGTAEEVDEGQKNSSKIPEEETKVVFVGDHTSMEEASNKNLYKSIMFQSMGIDPVSVIGKVGSELLKTVLRSAIGVAEDYIPEDSEYNYLEEVNKENQARYIQAVQEGNAKIQIPLDRDKLKEQIDGIIEYADENADKITWSDLETIAAILDSYQDLPEDLEAVFSNFTSYVAEKSDELDPSQIIEELKDNTKEYFENNSEQFEIPVKYTYEPTPEDLAQIQALLDETSARYHLDISDFEQTLVIDTQQAQENANQVQQNIESTNVEMPISGDTTEAIKNADQATKDISKKKSNIKVGIISDVEQKINEIIRKVQEKVLKLKIEGTVNLQTETTISSVKNSGANRAAGNVALAKGRRTLLGELGPELYVTGGHYYVAGQNGAEFVDLPDDAIVFNHLQTKRLMSTGTSSRGKAIGGEKRAVAHAKGNVEGPAMASASAALSALRNIRALWDSILNASLQDLGSKAGLGKSSGGGGGGNKNGAVLDAGYIRDLERWYNLLRQIDRLEQDINYQEQLRSKLEADSVSNGREIYESYRRSYEMLQKEVDSRVELAELKKGYYEQRMQEIEEGPWGDIFYFNGEGVPQMKNLDLLANVFASTEEGGAVHSAREQYALLQQAGFGDLMQFKEDGSRVEWYDEEGKEREEAYKEAVEAFSAKLDAQTDEVNTLREDYIEEMGNILELQTKQNEILTQIRENTIAVEEEVLKALEESRKAEIDELQKQRDALSNSTDKFIEGLTDSLNKEREMYNTQQNNQELVSMRRQLAILQRSGGSADQIRSLQQQIAQREQDSYFDQQQKQIDAVKEASDLQLERLDTQISLMTETLEYQKSNGLLWEGVHEIMQLTEAEIQDFITTNNPEWWSKSMTQRQNDLAELGNKIEQWVAHRDDISVLGETIKTAINEGIRAITEAEAKTSESQPYTAYGDGGATTSTSSGSGGSSKGSGGGGSSGGSSTTVTKAESGTWLCVYYTTSGLPMAREEYTNQTAGAQISFSAHIKKFPGYTFSYADPIMATIPAGGTITMNYYYTKDPEKETEHGYRFVFNGQQVEGSGYRTKEQAAQAAGTRITNMLAQLDSSITEQRKKTIEKTAKSGLKVYERGGLIDFTGPAWVDGTKKKPEGILNAEQLEMLRNSVLTRRNPIAALLADYGDTIGNTANATTYNTIDHGMVSIDHVDVNLNIAKVSNDYDSRRIGQNVMDEMVKIAKKTKVNSLSRG